MPKKYFVTNCAERKTSIKREKEYRTQWDGGKQGKRGKDRCRSLLGQAACSLGPKVDEGPRPL